MGIRVKEFHSKQEEGERRIGVGKVVDEWLGKNKDIDILDIKYSANSFGSHALVIFKTKIKEK